MPATPAVRLRFDLQEALRLAQDAVTATNRRTRWVPGPTPDHPGTDVDAGPCLMLVRDDGVYLMSTDADAPKDASGRVPVCHANGFDPQRDDWWSNCVETGLPADDFVEYLELLKSGLLNEIRAAADHGYRWFVIHLTEEHLGHYFAH